MSAEYRVMTVRLPAALADRIDGKAKAEGMTRQQLLAALIDLGLDRRAVEDDKPGVLNASRTLQLLGDTDSMDGWNRGSRYRRELMAHLSALVDK